MSCLNDIESFNDNRLVQVGAGCTWDEIYKAVDAKGRIIVGGASDRGVGIAGYLLGGGCSMKTNQYGLGIDNVTEFEVALPNGYRVIANKNNNKELFEALRVRFSLTIIEPRSHRFEVGITLAS
jgi:FAD/FMN-containing dehydrogenase